MCIHIDTQTWTCAHKRKRGKDGGMRGKEEKREWWGTGEGERTLKVAWLVCSWCTVLHGNILMLFSFLGLFYVPTLALLFFLFLVRIILLHFKLPWILSGIRSNTTEYKQIPPSLADECFHTCVTQKHIKWWTARNKRCRPRAPSVTMRYLLLTSSLAGTSGTTNKCHQKLLRESRDREWAQKEHIQECRIIDRNDLMQQTGH